jgi:hypothetical protein
MRPLDRSEFRRSVRRLDQQSMARLVAATWRARGAEATVDGDAVTVSTRDGTRRMLVVRGPWATRRLGRRTLPADVDAVVVDRPVSDRPAGVDVVGPDDLRERLLYALPRDRAGEIAATHLGRPLLTEAAPAPALRDRLPGSPGSLDSLPAAAVLAVGLLVALVLAGSVGGLWTGDAPFDAGSDADADGARVGDFGASTDSTDDAGGTATPTPTPATTAERSRGFPPGLGPDGIRDPYRLAEAHADAVTTQPYELQLTYLEAVNGTERSRRVERVEVAAPTNYVTNVSGRGVPSADPPVVADVEAYADGGTRWERQVRRSRTANDSDYSATPTRTARARHGYYADRVERYLGWYLSVENSTITDAIDQNGVTYFWLGLGSDPYPGVENATGWALVTGEGVVLRLERTYETPDAPDATATVRIQYTNRGDEPVAEPAWVAAARDATGQGSNATTATNATATGTTNAP